MISVFFLHDASKRTHKVDLKLTDEAAMLDTSLLSPPLFPLPDTCSNYLPSALSTV